MAAGSQSPVDTAEESAAKQAPADVRQGAPHAEVDVAPGAAKAAKTAKAASHGGAGASRTGETGELAAVTEPGQEGRGPDANEHPAESSAMSAYDSELTMLLRTAAWIGQGADEDPAFVSFTSLFLAFLASRGPLPSWVQGKAEWIGPALEDIVRRWRIRAPGIKGLDAERVRQASRLGEAELPLSYETSGSADHLLRKARGLAGELGERGPLGARHVLAAFVYELENLRDLEAWKFDREAWATRIVGLMIEMSPDRAEAWQALHDRHFPRPPAVSLTAALRWASWRAGEDADALDSTLLLDGVMLLGLADEKKGSSAWQLVKQIGAGIEALELEVPEDAELPEETLPLAPELLPVMARARVFATATRPRRHPEHDDAPCGVLSVRHVIAAILTDPRPLGAFERLRQAKRTEGGVLAQFRQWLCTIGPGNDDCEVWRELFDEHRDDVLAGYDNDEAKGEDRLGIDRDVRALAAVLASTKVTPPLSVGLFGDWGSGKSFFMGKLRERIEQLASAAQAKPDAESWFCGKRGAVVQIDFNAWHYMDADLWSSLAVRVFDALSENLSKQFIEACRENITALKEREQQLETERQALEASAAALEQLLVEQRAARTARELRLGELARRLAEEQLQKIKTDPKVAKVTAQLRLEGDNVKRQLQSAQRDLQYVGGRAELWWRTLRSPARAITLALVLALPALAALIVDQLTGKIGPTFITAVAAYMAALTALFTRIRSFVAQVAGSVDAAVSEVARIEEELRERKSPEELGLEAERDSSSARIAELEREQMVVSKRKTELEAEILALQHADAKTLRDFILERAAAQDYRKNLGVISAIHHDFKQLADFLEPTSGAGPNVERIVLYIDDLDRCPPRRVVEVLQAIHIILSLPLFVVVVGVDSRWLLDSLSAFYREQFPRDAVTLDVARPQQYLEKIFQVPYTLTPMTDEGYSALVAGMLGAPAVSPAAAAAAAMATSGRRRTRASDGALAGGVVVRPGARPTRPSRTTGTRRAEVGGRRSGADSIDLMPQSLRLEPEELAYLQSLGRLVPTPRAAKRLVNLYRIVRASLDDDELMRLLGGHYRLLQICLGLVVGYSSFGADLFSQILSGRISSRMELLGWLEQRGQGRKNEHGEEVGLDVREVAALSVLQGSSAEFRDWAVVEATVRRVGRFSFETGRTLALHAALVRNAAAVAATSE